MLSKIFHWYRTDFGTKDSELLKYVFNVLFVAEDCLKWYGDFSMASHKSADWTNSDAFFVVMTQVMTNLFQIGPIQGRHNMPLAEFHSNF